MSVVTVQREQAPGRVIEAFADVGLVGARMDLTDFLNAIVDEVGNPAFMLTTEQLRQRVHAASAKVVSDMKATTAYLATPKPVGASTGS